MSSRFQLAETEGTAPLGAVIDKRAAPEPSCPPAAQATKTIDLVDSKSASVNADRMNGENPLFAGLPAVSPPCVPGHRPAQAG